MLQYFYMKKHPPLVIGNWKMNPISTSEVVLLLRAVAKLVKKYPTVAVAVAPPFPYISMCNKIAPLVGIVAQTMYHQPRGAFTGEVSPVMLTDLGVHTVLVGHSERRARGETNEDITKKVQAALKYKLTPVICVGEVARDGNGNFFTAVEDQIVSALIGVPKARFKDLVLAYEPIWAISNGNGNGCTATTDDVIEMRLFITKVIIKHFGRNASVQLRVIYGGSVNEKNTAELWATKRVDGFLVGGASLRAEAFTKIVSIIAKAIK